MGMAEAMAATSGDTWWLSCMALHCGRFERRQHCNRKRKQLPELGNLAPILGPWWTVRCTLWVSALAFYAQVVAFELLGRVLMVDAFFVSYNRLMSSALVAFGTDSLERRKRVFGTHCSIKVIVFFGESVWDWIEGEGH